MKKIRYITLQKILWHVTGRFILEFILDFSHNIQGKKPYWNDAESCKRYFCRYCGGKFYKKRRKKMSIKNNCRDCRYLLSDNRGWYDCYQRDIYKYSTFPFRYTSCRYFKKKTLLFKILEYFRSKK